MILLRYLPAAFVLFVSLVSHAQIGSVKTDGIEVAGSVTVRDGKAMLGSKAIVTASAQPAQIMLDRGGVVKVCAGSSAHLSATVDQTVKHPPVLIALDRGSLEIHMAAEKTDSVLTPDMRLEFAGPAPLDLRIRIVPNGDACIENAGKNAPVIHVTDAFGEAAYFVRPGQRVLFEHGSLREVVDKESSSCGCPSNSGLVLAGKAKRSKSQEQVAETNPFPEAVSQGLAAPSLPTPTPAGQEHTQVSSVLMYDGKTNAVSGPPGQVTTAADVAAASSAAAPKPAAVGSSAADVHLESATPPPAGPNPFRSIGRFFRRMFGGH